MNLSIVKIKRIAFKENYTIGRLYVDDIYICDTIEDKVRELNTAEDKVYGKTAIPAGTYPADLYFSRKFGYTVVRLFKVPFFEGIYIHKGNTEKDSLGCIIVGYNDKVGWVSRPTKAMTKIVDTLRGRQIEVVVE